MSRRKYRQAQNAASLIRPSAVVKVCQAPLIEGSTFKCGAYAIACYDGELNHVTDLCFHHRQVQGYCIHCGNALTDAEKQRKPHGYCVACLPERVVRAWDDEARDDDEPAESELENIELDEWDDL